MSATATIVAIATPPGRGGIGIIRVSGPGVVSIAKQILGKLPAPRYAEYLPFLNSDNPLRMFATDPNSNAITYKFGLSLKGKRNLSKNIWLYSTLFYAYQIGSIENSKEASSLDIEGAYRFLDLGIKVNKISDLINPKISFSLGYNNKHWAMDNIDVSVSGFDISKISSQLSNNLSSNYIYFSFGYEF